MTYLRQWRLTLAPDLLREEAATLDAVARQVGFGNGFALSTAFKRLRGISPRDHRAGQLGATGDEAARPATATTPVGAAARTAPV